MDPIALIDEFVGRPTCEVSTIVAEADAAGSLAGKSWTFVTTNKDSVDTVNQVYYIVNSVGADPTLGSAEASKFIARADSSSDLASKYFYIYDGISTSETAYYAYFTVAGVGYDPGVGRAEVTRLTLPADTAGNKDGTYWTLSNGADEGFYAWYAKDASSTDPAPTGTTGIRVDYAAGDTAVVLAQKTAAAMNDDNSNVHFSVANIHSANGTAQVTDVVCVADVAGSLNGTYFTFSVPGAADTNVNTQTHYYCWIAVGTASTEDPVVSNHTGVEATIAADDTANAVGTAVAAAINALTGTGASNSSGTVTITNTYKGVAELCKDAPDATRFATGFTFEDPATTPGLDPDILVTNLAVGAASNTADVDTGITNVAVVTAGVDAVGALSTKTLLAVIPVIAEGDNGTAVNLATHTALNATAYTSVNSTSYVTLTHPTKGNCTNAADGNVGGGFAASTTTAGVDPNTNTSISVAIATGANGTVIATATAVAINAVYNIAGSYIAVVTTSTADIIVTNSWGGVVANAADSDTGWSSFTETTAGSAVVTYNAITDLATSNYIYKPNLDEVSYIREISISLSDSAATDMTLFGALTWSGGSGLDIRICKADGTSKKTIVSALKTNGELLAIGGQHDLISTTGIVMHMNLVDAYGSEVAIDGHNGEYLDLDLNANPNGLITFYMRVKGHLRETLAV